MNEDVAVFDGVEVPVTVMYAVREPVCVRVLLGVVVTDAVIDAVTVAVPVIVEEAVMDGVIV